MIGAAQWVASLGHLDVATAIMTLARFDSAPLQGHLDHIKSVFGYFEKMRQAKPQLRVNWPDFSTILIPNHDWTRTIYGTMEM